MCFSPAASFTTAAVTAAIGLVCVARRQDRAELGLAAMPLLFAAQQVIEGLLWLQMPTAPGGSVTGGLVLAFLLMAKVFWPAYAPAAMMLMETDPRRRLAMSPWLLAGVLVSAYLLTGLVTHPSTARVIEDHIVYVTERREPLWIAAPYLAAVTFPLLLSSRRFVAALGVVILIGAVVTYQVYWEAFMSVWCFFSAAASALVLLHFETRRRWTVAAV